MVPKTGCVLPRAKTCVGDFVLSFNRRRTKPRNPIIVNIKRAFCSEETLSVVGWRRAETRVDVRVMWSLLFDFEKQVEGTGKILTTPPNAKFHENPWSCSRPYVAELADIYNCLNQSL